MISHALKSIAPNPLLTAAAMEDLDRVIRAIPDYQLRSADHDMTGMDQKVSVEPWTYFGHLRDTQGDVIQYVDGRYGDVEVYNGFGQELNKPNFAVIGYNALRSMVMDKTNFVNEGAYGAHGDAQQPGFTFVNELDGADHRAMRRLFDLDVFSRQYLVDFNENTVGPLADFLTQRIRNLIDNGEPADLCRDLALPLLYMSMARVVGVNMTDLNYFVRLGEKAFSGPRDFEGAQAASAELTEFFQRSYDERLAKGDLDKGDLMSIMNSAERDGLKFNPHEVVVYCRFFLPAGIETTWRQTANLGYAFMTHPQQYDAVVMDPTLWPQATEEVLRWMPSGSVLPRMAGQDAELAGVRIPKGSSLYGVFNVANRDPRVWNDPDKFDIWRERKGHLTFSMGSHSCMGQQLARQSFHHVVRAMTEVLPDMVLDGDVEDMRTTGYIIRCPDKVPVRRR